VIYISTTIAAMIVAALTVGAASMPEDQIDFRDLYPGPQAFVENRYLEGDNWVTGSPQRSVLHFRERSRGNWSQYNWGPTDPQARCNEDRFRWTKRYLVYKFTKTTCGDRDEKTQYKPAVKYLPTTWDGESIWSKSGTSVVTHEERGAVVRSGVTEWWSEIRGWVKFQPGRQVVWVQVDLRTSWDGEPLSNDTFWVEDLYIDPEFGLVRHVGGNANQDFNWDVWFTGWELMP